MSTYIQQALARSEARPVKRIDYDRMQQVWPRQKAALTRATKTGDAEKVAAVCIAAMDVWDEIGAWPDDWRLFQRALDDVLPWNSRVELADLRGAR